MTAHAAVSRMGGLGVFVALLWPCLSSHAAEPSTPGRFDGRWWISLTCDDAQDPQGRRAKGYTFSFWADVDRGHLSGRYGEPGKPSSVVYAGTIEADGAVEIRATGNTGNAEYTIGRVASGSAYGYTLTGRLEGDHGTAVRREVRPCTATLTRKPAS